MQIRQNLACQHINSQSKHIASQTRSDNKLTYSDWGVCAPLSNCHLLIAACSRRGVPAAWPQENGPFCLIDRYAIPFSAAVNSDGGWLLSARHRVPEGSVEGTAPGASPSPVAGAPLGAASPLPEPPRREGLVRQPRTIRGRIIRALVVPLAAMLSLLGFIAVGE